MRVLFVTSEVATLFKLGGLGDVSHALPLALKHLGVDIAIALPFFTKIKARHTTCIGPLAVSFNGKRELVFLFRMTLEKSNVPLILFRHPILNEYNGAPPLDSITRFAFFSKAVATYIVVEALSNRTFDVIHCNDWHTALIPLLLGESLKVFFRHTNHQYRFLQQETLASGAVKSVLTIHNPAYQGTTSTDLVSKIALDRRQMQELYDGGDNYINLLREGIQYADVITTVSPTFAKEMLKVDYGRHVSGVLKRRKDHIVGILNGIDTKLWDPTRDSSLPLNYDRRSVFTAKPKIKAYLQRALRLPEADVPLFGFVGRLEARQKGIDILVRASQDLPKDTFQLVILGTGDKNQVKILSKLADQNRHVAFINTFDERLARRIYAGSDIMLVPSKFEPCGLTQMIAMRYGTIPLVRKTGGLADSVINGKTGFVFNEYKSIGLSKKMKEAISVWKKKPQREKMIAAAMQQDFSWRHSAKTYRQLYIKLIKTQIPSGSRG